MQTCLLNNFFIFHLQKISGKEILVFISEMNFPFVFILNFPIFSYRQITLGDIFHFVDSAISGTTPNSNPRFKMILWLIIAGTRGGINRAKILNLLANTPSNANKIATILNLDHKTVIHHVNILTKNELVVKEEKDYGAAYNLTQIMKDNHNVLMEIMGKIGTK